MRNHPRRRRSAPALVVAVLAALILAPASVAGRPVAPVSATPSESLDLATLLTPGGRFVGSPGIAGSADARSWALVSAIGAGEAPRFAPIGVDVVTPTGPWSAIPSNVAGASALSGTVLAIAVSGSSVYVGGSFVDAAGIPEADYVAKWNGTTWSALGSRGAGLGALTGAVRSFAISGANVYVGGDFVNAANVLTADYLARWNGSAWAGLGNNGAQGAFNGPVHSLAVSGTNLYAGGGFLDAGGDLTADAIAKWNGSGWSALGSNGAGNGAIPCNGCYVSSIVLSGSNVYAGGLFSDAGGILQADNIAKWNGSAWSALGANGAGGALNQAVFDMAFLGTSLYVGGTFTNAGGVPAADYIAKWNGTTWSSLGSSGSGNGQLNFWIQSLAVVGDELYVGGNFANTEVPKARKIAKWDGAGWFALGTNGADGAPIVDNVLALGVYGGHLIVGGDFTDAAKIPTADKIARWYLPPFTDIAGTTFEADIIWVWLQGITSGCSQTLYCPLANVTRGEMASFLARALHLPPTATDYFTDDETSSHEANINRIAAAGITTGCGGGKYCPLANVTRGEMASFLARALDLPSTANDYFTDDETSSHEDNINRAAAAGITSGCGPGKYCPTANVTRGQMAAFLHRAFE